MYRKEIYRQEGPLRSFLIRPFGIPMCSRIIFCLLKARNKGLPLSRIAQQATRLKTSFGFALNKRFSLGIESVYAFLLNYHTRRASNSIAIVAFYFVRTILHCIRANANVDSVVFSRGCVVCETRVQNDGFVIWHLEKMEADLCCCEGSAKT